MLPLTLQKLFPRAASGQHGLRKGHCDAELHVDVLQSSPRMSSPVHGMRPGDRLPA